MLAALLLLASLVDARQLSYDLSPVSDDYVLQARWKDAADRTQQVRAVLDGAAVGSPKSLRYDVSGIVREAAADVRAWAARERHDVKVRAGASSLQMSIRAESARDLRRLEQEAEQVRDAAYAEALEERGLMERSDGVSVDHARMAREYAGSVQPLALALADGLSTGSRASEADARTFLERALAFTQSIPYRAGGSRGVKTPIGVLWTNRGDCDSKTTLLLALLHAAYPRVPSAVVYVPRHALAAVGLSPQQGDATLEGDGRRWVLAEPVGPRLMLPGDIASRTRWKLARHDLRAL